MQLIIRLVLLSSVFHCCLAVLWKRCQLTKSRWTMERKKILLGLMQPGFTAQPSVVYKKKNPKCMQQWQESPPHNVCPECCILLLRLWSWTDSTIPKWSCLNQAEGLAQTGLPDHLKKKTRKLFKDRHTWKLPTYLKYCQTPTVGIKF